MLSLMSIPKLTKRNKFAFWIIVRVFGCECGFYYV